MTLFSGWQLAPTVSALSGGADEAVRLWNLEQGTCADILVAHKGAVTGVAISNSAKLAVSASLDATMRIWNLFYGTMHYDFGERGGPLHGRCRL